MKVMKMPRNTRIAPKAQEAFFPLGAHKMHTAEDLGIYIYIYLQGHPGLRIREHRAYM